MSGTLKLLGTFFIILAVVKFGIAFYCKWREDHADR